jgi:hypothetical protein
MGSPLVAEGERLIVLVIEAAWVDVRVVDGVRETVGAGVCEMVARGRAVGQAAV